MAGFILPAVKEKLSSAAESFGEDPLAWLVRTLLRFGSALLLAGLLLGTLGYFLKAAATAAANNELNVLGNIGTIFSNIKAPSFQPAPTGTAPLSWSLNGVQNFFSDAWQDVQAAGSDIAQIGSAIGTVAEDVVVGLEDIAKAFLAFVTHFPDILWNGLVWGVGGAIADILSWLFPWIVLIGAALLVIGLAIWGIRKVWDATVGAAWKSSSSKWLERRKASAERIFDKIFRNPQEPTLELPTRAPGPDLPIGGAPAAAAASAPFVGRESDAIEPPVTLGELPEDTGAQGEPGAAPPAGEPSATPPEEPPRPAPEDLPLQEPPKREELEQTLGDGYVEAKDRMRAALRADQTLSPASSSA